MFEGQKASGMLWMKGELGRVGYLKGTRQVESGSMLVSVAGRTIVAGEESTSKARQDFWDKVRGKASADWVEGNTRDLGKTQRWPNLSRDSEGKEERSSLLFFFY